MDIVSDWMDLFWVPMAIVAAHKGQRGKTVLFVLACVLALRLQVELLTEIGYPTGIFPFLDFSLLQRGFVIYGAFIAVFLSMLHLSREKDPYIYIAAAITVFTVAFCVSSAVMVL